MSERATKWAAAQRPNNAPDKLVLWALADAHNRTTGLVCPSVAALVDFTGYQRKAVLAALKRLAESGLIDDTGQRVGRTRQVKVWRLGCDAKTVPEKDRSPT